MTLRSGHGRGAGRPHIEVLPADELPKPPVGVLPEPARPVARRHDGRLAGTDAAKELGRLGGIAKARRVRLVDSLGLAKIAEDSAFAPYRIAADEFVSHEIADLARTAGCGQLGPAPSTMVASAGLQLAASRFCFDRFAQTGDATWAKLGSQLSNDSRQNLLAAFEVAVREAKARAEARGPADPLADHIAPDPPEAA